MLFKLMQAKYRARDLSTDIRPIRAPLVPVIQLQALGKQEAHYSPTFGSVLSNFRPKRAGMTRTRSNSQRRQPRPEVTQSRDLFLLEEYRKADLVQARKLPCARSPYWHIPFYPDSSDFNLAKEPASISTQRSALTKWLAVPLT